jgi:hypothetical protein
VIDDIVKLVVSIIVYVLLCVVYGVNLDGDAFNVGMALIVVFAPWTITDERTDGANSG